MVAGRRQCSPIEAVLDNLVTRGWVREIPPDTSGMGRPAIRFGFRADAGFVVGVDIGADKILTALADLNGDVVALQRTPLRHTDSAVQRLELAEQATLACLDGVGISRTCVWAVCAGTTGIVDRSGHVTWSTVLSGWTGVDLAGLAGRWFGCTGMAENDANLAAIAEHWRGTAQHASDIIYILVGHRAGAGILLNGRLHRGRRGGAGEIGGLRHVDWEDASAELTKSADASEVFAAAAARDPDALQAVNRFAENLAIGAAALAMSVDPDLIVIGSDYPYAAETLLAPMRRHLRELSPSPPS